MPDQDCDGKKCSTCNRTNKKIQEVRKKLKDTEDRLRDSEENARNTALAHEQTQAELDRLRPLYEVLRQDYKAVAEEATELRPAAAPTNAATPYPHAPTPYKMLSQDLSRRLRDSKENARIVTFAHEQDQAELYRLRPLYADLRHDYKTVVDELIALRSATAPADAAASRPKVPTPSEMLAQALSRKLICVACYRQRRACDGQLPCAHCTVDKLVEGCKYGRCRRYKNGEKGKKGAACRTKNCSAIHDELGYGYDADIAREIGQSEGAIKTKT
ncbi:hypothetical protein BU16DRAFT_566331 [Lophium mytilinum]|uniref:Zn(2)-C6 fungal-type domain-containing protein n=1 Tax=Lophium mytilinum TaxID=390894 RepID=A0A6A6QDW7_9PEZI|nr:hypothetical protein BU16DRAFT_566331 [Lophium mytilinum]